MRKMHVIALLGVMFLGLVTLNVIGQDFPYRTGAFLPLEDQSVSGQWNWRGQLTPWYIEGATEDGFEIAFTFTEPTADRTITWPNQSVTFADMGAASAILATTLTTNNVDAANSVWGVSNGLTFEGATADAGELFLTVANIATASRTMTLPDMGAASAVLASTLTTNAVGVLNSVWGVSNGLTFEGATADAGELFLTVADIATASRTMTLPDMGAASAVLATTLTTNTVGAANSVWGVSNGLTFEGATADAGELFLTVANIATASRTMTLPDMGAASAVLASTLTTNTVDAANSVWGVSNGVVFEGLTADAFEITVAPADAAADATITLPGLTGTASVMGLTAGGATITLTAVSHAGTCVALDTAAGTTVTLPAATGTGNRYCFVVTVTPTSNQHRINVVGNDEFVGTAWSQTDTGSTVAFWGAADAGDNDQFNMNSGSQGGEVGDRVYIIDISTDNWSIEAFIAGSGTEATPFATGQVA